MDYGFRTAPHALDPHLAITQVSAEVHDRAKPRVEPGRIVTWGRAGRPLGPPHGVFPH